ncbi:MAG: hypothetical protein FJY35_02710 [Betaproteobacteria bacterium]|nr:hypothetical protein [Betaproteobacteria bacterium]
MVTIRKEAAIGIFCHDAGAATFLALWALAHEGPKYFCVQGPSLAIFHSILGIIPLSSLEEATSQANIFLCGSSWQSDLEKIATRAGKLLGKRSIVYLDHWSNYKDRFVLNEVESHPDEIWVSNVHAFDIASKIFSSVKITLVSDIVRASYLEEANRLKSVVRKIPGMVLFVCENISEHYGKKYGNPRALGYDEFDAIDFFFLNLFQISPNATRVRIRHHPSEPADKYRSYFRVKPTLQFSGPDVPLLKDLLEAEVIVGCQSQALVTAVELGLNTVSCIPPNGKKCCLPQSGIRHFKTFEEK